MAPAMARKTQKLSSSDLLHRPKRRTVMMKESCKNAERKEKMKNISSIKNKVEESKSESSSSSSTKKVSKTFQAKRIRSRKKETPIKKNFKGAKKFEEKKTISQYKEKDDSDVQKIEKEEIEEEEVKEESHEICLDAHERKNHPDEKDSQLGSDEESDRSSDPDDGEQENDGDMDFDPENDPDKLWCFCRRPHGNRFMICCDLCEDWFHGECVGISIHKGREMEKTGEEWCCDKCKNPQQNDLPSKSPLNSPLLKETENCLSLAAATHAHSLSLDTVKSIFTKSPSNNPENLSENKASEDLKYLADSEPQHNEEIKLTNDFSKRTVLEKIKTDRVKDTLEKIRARRRESSGKTKDFIKFEQVPTQSDDHHRESKRNLSFGSDDVEDSKRKQGEEQIHKNKVRITPTPTKSNNLTCCVREDCSRSVMKGSIYCSRECIYKYANESMKFLEEEKKKSAVSMKSPDKMMRTSAHGITVISPATSSTDRVTESTQERIAVFEKATGKVIAGVMAPTKKYLFAWLEEHPTYEVLKPGKQPDSLKNVKKDQDELVRSSVRRALRQALIGRCKQDELLVIQVESIGKLCKKIESELLKMFGETGQKYKSKYRSLIFNLKDNQNKILYKRVVSGEITPYELVHMTPEQLATPALAQWREQESKHHLELVKKRELEEAEMLKTPRVKQTHKGEIEIVGEKEDLGNLEIKAEVVENSRVSTSAPDIMKFLNDTTAEHNHHLFDANCKICTGKMAPPGESQVLGVSTTVVQAEPESSMPSPEDDIDMAIIGSSPVSVDTPVATPITPASPIAVPQLVSQSKQPSVWRGFVMMQKVAKFITTAYQVSGSCENLMQILPDTVHVCGRIPPDQVWEYLTQLKTGRKNKYIDVIRFEMSSKEEKAGYIKLYTYFYQRHRIGVVGNCSAGVKDMYILPLASQEMIPQELQPLPGLPKPRPHMLLGIIIRVKPAQVSKEILPVDSSPEVVIKRKKKKKDKKKEKELEAQLETQKKLVDIIFQNRTIQAAIGTDSPLALLKSIEGNEKAKTPKSSSAEAPAQDEVEQKVKVQNESSCLQEEVGVVSLDNKKDELVLIPDPDSLAKNIRENVLCMLHDAKEKGVIKHTEDSNQFKSGCKNSSDMFKQNDSQVESISQKLIPENTIHQTESQKEETTFEIPLLGITSTVEPSCSHNSQSTLNLSEEDYAINLIEDIKTPQYPKIPFDFMKHREENKMPELPVINLPSTLSFKFQNEPAGSTQTVIPLPIPGSIPQVPLPPNIINKLPPGVPLPPLPPQRPTVSVYRQPADPRTSFRSNQYTSPEIYSDNESIGLNKKTKSVRDSYNLSFDRNQKVFSFDGEKVDSNTRLANVDGDWSVRSNNPERSSYPRHQQNIQRDDSNRNNRFSTYENFSTQRSNVSSNDQQFSMPIKNNYVLDGQVQSFHEPSFFPTEHQGSFQQERSESFVHQPNSKQFPFNNPQPDFSRLPINRSPINEFKTIQENRFIDGNLSRSLSGNPRGPMPLPPGPRPMLSHYMPRFSDRIPINHEGNLRFRQHFEETTDDYPIHRSKRHFRQDFQNISPPFREEFHPESNLNYQDDRNHPTAPFSCDGDFQRNEHFEWNAYNSDQHENFYQKPNKFRKRHFNNPNPESCFTEEFDEGVSSDFHSSENWNSNGNPAFMSNRPQRFQNRSHNRPPRGRGHYPKWQNQHNQPWGNF